MGGELGWLVLSPSIRPAQHLSPPHLTQTPPQPGWPLFEAIVWMPVVGFLLLLNTPPLNPSSQPVAVFLTRPREIPALAQLVPA